MRHGSLFSGIGGFDLAADRMGWENIFHCEINDFCRKVLHHYWPDAIQYNDITKTDFSIHANNIDIITGGFPCQPYSLAGKRKGKEDDRHLWPEMLRAIREIQPRWIVGENVPGLVNWERGMVLKEIKTDLENEGFEIFGTLIIPACAKDAPHKRERLWIVANSSSKHSNLSIQQRRQDKAENVDIDRIRQKQYAPFSEGLRLQRWEQATKKWSVEKQSRRLYSDNNRFEGFPSVSPLCVGNDGISSRLDVETISFSKWRNESIKAAGNAVVWQVVYEIFKAIETFESQILNQ